MKTYEEGKKECEEFATRIETQRVRRARALTNARKLARKRKVEARMTTTKRSKKIK